MGFLGFEEFGSTDRASSTNASAAALLSGCLTKAQNTAGGVFTRDAQETLLLKDVDASLGYMIPRSLIMALLFLADDTSNYNR